LIAMISHVFFMLALVELLQLTTIAATIGSPAL